MIGLIDERRTLPDIGTIVPMIGTQKDLWQSSSKETITKATSKHSNRHTIHAKVL